MNGSGKPSTNEAAVHRVGRIAKGFADASRRDRYLGEARRRLRSGYANLSAAQESLQCLVCGSRRVKAKTVIFAGDPSRMCRVHTCRDCGYLHMPKLKSRYREMSTLEQLGSRKRMPKFESRVGTDEHPGREFHMAKMAIDILGQDNIEVLVYGAGGNRDNHHIARLREVRHVAIGDIMKLRDDAEFVDLNQPAPRKFPVVVASEVIEHFRSPREDFAKLLGFVEDDGLVVCGTSIYAGGDLSRDKYIFFADHTSYFTPPVLRRIANDTGYRIDFRAPMIALGMRKRYVLFSRSQAVMESIACYFGTELYAPSEKSRPKRPPVQESHQPWRPLATTRPSESASADERDD